mgnify:CR=1 FL=1
MNVQKLWEELNIVERAWKRPGKKFWLLDGPPYPNAEPHLGHVRGVTVKDMLMKMKMMQGYRVYIKPGFDCHGLPIENKIEREMGIGSKREIVEKVGMEKFIEKCKKFATSNIDMWMKFYRDMGVWFAWAKPYFTLERDYMSSVWWSIAKLWEKGLLKKGKKPFYWCPHCETVLSGYEVTDEYRELRDPSIYVKFPTEEGFSLLVWTTTPWTLAGNVALVVRGDADYVMVDVEGERIVLAEKRVKVLDELGVKYRVLKKMKGKELEGIKYYPVIDCKAQGKLDKDERARRVYLSIPVIKQKVAGKIAEKKEVEEEETIVEHFTSLEEGTGIVHCAPGHGPEDYELGMHYNLPVLSPVDDGGRFTSEVEQFEGMRVREASGKVVEYLRNGGYLLASEEIVHRYPVCWRCKTPLIFRTTEQWILDIEKIKKQLIREVKNIRWLPEFARERMLRWVANAKEWTLSRQRFWNIPMPIWECKNGHVKVVSGAEELEKLSGKKVEDLHRDVVDKITFKCPECGAEMHRVEDVLDVWYDSGASSFAVFGYPKNRELFDQLWPTDRIEEGQDQIRGWFYTLLVLGVAVFGRAPYREVSMHGWVVDEKGEKMSKSKGNFITAREAMNMLGPDMLRFYILWESLPWENLRFSPSRAKKEIGKMFNVWRNIHRYLVEYVETEPKKGALTVEDRWILSRLNTVIKIFLESVETYRLSSGLREIWNFIVNDFSRDYMKLAKERVRKGDTTALWVIREVHRTLTRLLAPIVPFMAEEFHAELAERWGGEKSVFLERYPEVNPAMIDEELEDKMKATLSVVEAVLAYRDAKRIGIRYPLPKVGYTSSKLRGMESVIKRIANVKEVVEGVVEGDPVETAAGKIYIDGELKEEHWMEGYMREIARRVQLLRKEMGLKPSQKISLALWGDEKLLQAVRRFEKEFRERVGAGVILYREMKGKTKREWRIKGMVIGAAVI